MANTTALAIANQAKATLPETAEKDGFKMIPLSMINSGEQSSIKKVGGNDDIRKLLKSLGFVVGSLVTVITKIDGNIIVNVKEARIAISKEMAGKIYV